MIPLQLDIMRRRTVSTCLLRNATTENRIRHYLNAHSLCWQFVELTSRQPLAVPQTSAQGQIRGANWSKNIWTHRKVLVWKSNPWLFWGRDMWHEEFHTAILFSQVAQRFGPDFTQIPSASFCICSKLDKNNDSESLSIAEKKVFEEKKKKRNPHIENDIFVKWTWSLWGKQMSVENH